LEDKLRRARHDLRGKLNALKLCVSAIEVVKSPRERLEFIDMIVQSADATATALDLLEAAPGHPQNGPEN
jgi:hypothetical protein